MKNDRIVPILGIWEDKEPDTLLCAVSPWISGGQLDHYLLITQPQRIDALCLMHDIASGLDYMHNTNSGVVHGDLKPYEDNILVRDGREFITDFGLSHIMDDVSGFTSQVHGHPMWLAPEAVMAKCQSDSENQSFKPTFAQDMYSFGCLFLFVVHRQMPFGMLGDSPESIYISREKRMHEAPITKKDGLRFGIDDYQLMLECWRIDPMLRITARLALKNVGSLLDAERYGNSNHVKEVPFPRQITLASKRRDVTEGSSSCFQISSHQTSYVASKTRPSLSECPELAFGLVTWRKQCWIEGGEDRSFPLSSSTLESAARCDLDTTCLMDPVSSSIGLYQGVEIIKDVGTQTYRIFFARSAADWHFQQLRRAELEAAYCNSHVENLLQNAGEIPQQRLRAIRTNASDFNQATQQYNRRVTRWCRRLSVRTGGGREDGRIDEDISSHGSLFDMDSKLPHEYENAHRIEKQGRSFSVFGRIGFILYGEYHIKAQAKKMADLQQSPLNAWPSLNLLLLCRRTVVSYPLNANPG
ncbi:hypothetical protein ACEPAI_4235 [Sanghuangporus weigelae]